MKLHLNFIAWWLGKHFIIAGVLLLFYFVIGAFTNFETFDMGFILMLFEVIMVFVPSTWAMSGKLFPLSMGASRRQFFWMGQVLKLICLVIVSVCMWQVTPYPMAAVICSLFAAMCSGELFGALSGRFGKKGMIIFTALCACLGGIAGASYSAGLETTTLMMPMMMQPAVPVVSVVIGCCETVVSWLIYRKMEVQ